MRQRRSLMVALAVLALVPLPLLAQGGGQRGGGARMGGQQQRPMMAARMLVEQGSVEYPVSKAGELGLNADQTARLNEIGAAWAAATKKERDQIRAAMPQPRQRMADGDREAMMQQRRALQPLMQKLQEEDRKSFDQALRLLDEAQQALAKTLVGERAPIRRRPLPSAAAARRRGV